MRLKFFTSKGIIISEFFFNLIGVCFLLSLSACSFHLASKPFTCHAMKTKDSLPQEAPKGYVIFYHWTSGTRLGTVASKEPDVYSVQGTKENREVNQIDWAGQGFVMHRVLISKPPGQYDFVLKYGKASKKIHIEVDDQKLTPVEVKMIETGRTNLIEKTTVYGYIEARIGRSLPAKLDASALYALVDALEDRDWGVRFHAAEALEKMGAIVNEQGIEQLRELSQNDPHEAVRQAAKDAVENILDEKGTGGQ